MKIGPAKIWMVLFFPYSSYCSKWLIWTGWNKDRSGSILLLLLLCLKKWWDAQQQWDLSIHRPYFSFPSIFSIRSSAQGLDLFFPPNRGVWLVALDLVTVFRLGGAHFQGKLIRRYSSTYYWSLRLYTGQSKYRIDSAQYDIHSNANAASFPLQIDQWIHPQRNIQ